MTKKQNPETEELPKVHKDLEGFNIDINDFGEISTSMNITDLNKFLNKNVEDKKLKDRHDIDELKK